MNEWIPLLVAMLAFCSMAGITFVAGQYYLRAVHLTRRMPVPQGAPLQAAEATGPIVGFVARHFDEKRFGVDAAKRGKLRLSLVQAGYFRRDAVNFYLFWRLAALILLPVGAYLVFRLAIPNAAVGPKIIAISFDGAVGIVDLHSFPTRSCFRLEAHNVVHVAVV